ncbi:MAG: BlaI/MecI/CopY family transcriptional regulator [Candidatus Hydrogenedentes bacterium]|nr:BlaI/MecI/CopY family transcriptional regulator [Candidatus Hydrogenedentota bacterium]
MKHKQEPQAAPKLSEMEWEIMKPLWKHGPMAARDIYERVPDRFGWAYETVKSMLVRLVKKGALTYDHIGNSFLYRAAYTRGQMTRDATGSFIRRVFDEGLSPFFAQFVREATEDEIALLKAELARRDERKSRKGDAKQ